MCESIRVRLDPVGQGVEGAALASGAGLAVVLARHDQEGVELVEPEGCGTALQQLREKGSGRNDQGLVICCEAVGLHEIGLH